MFKVADYLLQGQSADPSDAGVELRPLDTRGGRKPAYSLLVLVGALCRIARGRLTGDLAGVHINMAERLSLVRKSLVVALCRALGVPTVLHLHAAQLPQFYRGLPRLLQALVRWIFSLPACVVVLGGASRRFVVDELGVDPLKVEIVINGVPAPVMPRRNEEESPVQRMLFLGSDWQRKGLFDLLDAFAQPVFTDRRIELVVAGRGDVETARARVRALGIAERVRFEGWVDQQKASRLLASADLLVLPAYDEGLPLVILEALANGVAVVCSPVGEIPSVLTDGSNACFVQPGNVQDIARGLQSVLGDAKFRHRLESNGRRIYESQFSLARFYAQVSRIHQKHFRAAARAR